MSSPAAWKLAGRLLAGLHAVLAVWSVAGLAEWSVADVPWTPVSNPAFPRWLLLVHWCSVTIASGAFLYGYAARHRNTPRWMALGYGSMALVCVIETFGYMTGSGKYWAMAAEFSAYLAILGILNHSGFMAQHFVPVPEDAPGSAHH